MTHTGKCTRDGCGKPTGSVHRQFCQRCRYAKTRAAASVRRKVVVCLDCGAPPATAHGLYCAAHLADRRHRLRPGYGRSKPAVVRDRPFAPKPQEIEASESWWTTTGMTRDAFAQRAEVELTERMMKSKYGQMRGGPSIDQW
jgi:hypothetical protein